MKQAIVLSTQDLSLLKRGRTLEIHLGSETLQLLAEKSTAAQRRNLRNLARARKVLAKKRRNGK